MQGVLFIFTKFMHIWTFQVSVGGFSSAYKSWWKPSRAV